MFMRVYSMHADIRWNHRLNQVRAVNFKTIKNIINIININVLHHLNRNSIIRPLNRIVRIVIRFHRLRFAIVYVVFISSASWARSLRDVFEILFYFHFTFRRPQSVCRVHCENRVRTVIHHAVAAIIVMFGHWTAHTFQNVMTIRAPHVP